MKKRRKKLSERIVNEVWDEIHARSGGDDFLDCAGDEEISQEIYDALVNRVEDFLLGEDFR